MSVNLEVGMTAIRRDGERVGPRKPSRVREISIVGDVAYIPLTRGMTATVDVGDLDLVHNRTWHALQNKWTAYACSDAYEAEGRLPALRMHRVIMAPDPGFVVDHIDGNGLNNCRANLRIASETQNNQNQRLKANNTSGVKGVCWHRARGKWFAQISCNGKRMGIGYFANIEDAAAAYAKASNELHGQFGRTA